MKTNTVKSAIQIVATCLEAIRDVGAAGMPAGHLYAALMPMGCTLPQYEQVERVILGTGLVVKSGDLLRWAA